jgi:hypothetical protein
MNKLFAAVALVTIIASPAFAQSFDPSVGSGNIAQKNNGGDSALNAYAQQPQTHRNSVKPGNDTALFGRIGVE